MTRSLSRLQAIVLGVVVVCGLALTGVGFYAIGSRQWLWGDILHVSAGFPRIHGVEAGTRVRVQGIEAGEVEAIQPPAVPGEDVVLRLRLDGRLRSLLRSDARVQIVSEGMIGGKVVEIDPGTAEAPPIQDGAQLASRPTSDLTDVLDAVNATLLAIREGQGTVGMLVRDPQAYAHLVAVLQQSRQTLASFQEDADALKRLPVVRGYIEDPYALLCRPNCARSRRWFAEAELFEPGRAVLTADGRRRLDGLASWLAGLKSRGSEVVVVAYADANAPDPAAARTRTSQQSEAVSAYLQTHHAIQKLGWFASRKVTPLGMGCRLPPAPEEGGLPPDRVEVQVFVPQE